MKEKKIQTVCGPIDPEALGITLMHEHLLWDITNWWRGEPQEMSQKKYVYEPVTLQNRGWITWHLQKNKDNMIQNDIEVAIEEVNLYQRAGGCSLVDATLEDIGRDPKALRAISKETGLNIVMGSGYYVESTHPAYLKGMSKEDIAQRIIDEFTNGVGFDQIKPGIIGEIGISSIDNEEEFKSLRGAAIAQRETGAALTIHPPLFEESYHKIIDAVEEEGADLSKVILSHCDSTLENMDFHYSLAERGVTVEYDLFGLECLAGEEIFLPHDLQRIRSVKSMIEHGYGDRVTVSHDTAYKINLVRYGGYGYGHICNNIVPVMLREGISADDIRKILIDNPKRLLAF